MHFLVIINIIYKLCKKDCMTLLLCPCSASSYTNMSKCQYWILTPNKCRQTNKCKSKTVKQGKCFWDLLFYCHLMWDIAKFRKAFVQKW